MLRKYADFSADETNGWDESVKEAFKNVLERCGGLPLTLSIAGREVEYLSTAVQPRANAWITYKTQLEKLVIGIMR